MSRDPESEGLRIQIIGDSGPFSRTGKSIGYSVYYKGSEYLIDCGAPVFQALGVDGLRKVKGIICTHSHDDHKRWFTDIALFLHYSRDINQRLTLITTDTIHEEYEKNSRAALERTLTRDQRRVVEEPYEDFVKKIFIGPEAKFRIAGVPVDGKNHNNGIYWRVLNEQGKVVPPDKAKIVVQHHHKANRPRMLLFDESYREWVEPASFYHFGDEQFFKSDKREYVDKDTGMKFIVHNAHTWHGPPTIGVVVETENEQFFFTSDTAYDKELFKGLAETKNDVGLRCSTKEFLEAPIIVGDINDYIERVWSRERLHAVDDVYRAGYILQDTTTRNGIVHTDYSNLSTASFVNRTILTHSPDHFTSAIPLACEGRVFRIVSDTFFEEVGDNMRSFDADFYIKDMHRNYVAFKDPKGEYKIVDDGGVLHFRLWDEETEWMTVARVQLYVDILGRYFDMLDESDSKAFRVRDDGLVELLTFNDKGSSGSVLKDFRDKVEKKYKRGPYAAKKKTKKLLK
ncbi:hypothetical protein ACFL54_00565 [Planctomycetota bacterium]